MPKSDPRVDAYIAKAAPFARPVLEHLRAVVHDACPDVEETIKWGMPSFTYHGILCGLSAFKEYCAFTLWKGELIVEGAAKPSGMGQFGRITSVADLPPKAVLAKYVKKAMKLNEDGVQPPWLVKRQQRGPRPAPRTPAVLAAALKKNAKARATYAGLSPSHKREYVEWITEAKTDATRDRRIATTLEWLAAGKSRNWKYERKNSK